MGTVVSRPHLCLFRGSAFHGDEHSTRPIIHEVPVIYPGGGNGIAEGSGGCSGKDYHIIRRCDCKAGGCAGFQGGGYGDNLTRIETGRQRPTLIEGVRVFSPAIQRAASSTARVGCGSGIGREGWRGCIGYRWRKSRGGCAGWRRRRGGRKGGIRCIGRGWRQYRQGFNTSREG